MSMSSDNFNEMAYADRYIQYVAQGVGFIAGIVSFSLGILNCLTLKSACFAAGTILSIIGTILIVLEAPLCCIGLACTNRVYEFSQRFSYLLRAVVYFVAAVVPLLLCLLSPTVWLGAAPVATCGVLYGVRAFRRDQRDRGFEGDAEPAGGEQPGSKSNLLAMSWASYFPEQLTEKPVGLVALTGLDVERNPSHKAILDTFSQHRKPDRLPLRFVRNAVDHEYPKCKTKRTSYEWYIPKGILKCGWLRKHLVLVPSLVVVFFDLDWDDPQFREKQIECASRVRVVRECLAGRLTSVAVVLLQRKPALPLEEDLSAKERAPSLCSACDLNPNHLFVLVQTEHLYGYIIRLESAFFDLSQNYYHQEARRVKSHRDNLNKISHQLLFVRHQFKVAFYNELKQDQAAALKHYKECYTHILDLRLHEKHILETKVIAGFVNYKICKLLFQKNAMDAIKQFKAFTDYFKDRVGMMELAFEHYSWLSKQNELFGELFNEAVKLGLSAVQMQHPGIYFQEAARHAIMRKTHSQKLCRFVDLSDRPNPLADLNNLDFYGQRPWRQGNQSFDPPDYGKERDGIQALQNEELKVDLSAQIISLLGNAVRYFKKYKSPRTKQQLYVQMSEEHYNAKQYSECLSCLVAVLDDYRREGWWTILTCILQLCLRAAYAIAAPQPYVHACLELMNSRACLPELDRQRIQGGLVQLVATGAPPPPGQLPAADCADAQPAWVAAAAAASGEQREILVDMDKLKSFVKCRIAFTSKSYEANQPMCLHVYLLCDCVQDIEFSQLSVQFTNPAYNDLCNLSDSQQLTLRPNRPACIAFQLAAEPQDTGRELGVTSVSLVMSGPGLALRLRWKIDTAAAVAAAAAENPFHADATSASDSAGSATVAAGDWAELKHRPFTRVVPKAAQVSVNVTHESPALVNEFYPVTLALRNNEPTRIFNCRLSLALVSSAQQQLQGAARKISEAKGEQQQQQQQSSAQQDRGFHMTCDPMQSAKNPGDTPVDRLSDLDLGAIDIGATAARTFYCQIFQPGDKEISISFVSTPSVSVRDPFVLSTTTRSQSPWALDIAGSQLRLSQHVRVAGDSAPAPVDGETEAESGDPAEPKGSQLAGFLHTDDNSPVTVKESECLTECWILAADTVRTQNFRLGAYVIRWRRQAAQMRKQIQLPIVSTTVPLPAVNLYNLPLCVSLSLPPSGTVYQPVSLAYSLENRTAYPQEVQFSVDRSDCFMFSGMKTGRVLELQGRVLELQGRVLDLQGRVLDLQGRVLDLQGRQLQA
uniref:Foie-gras_1 domain-containing protein n=1 Tax=Macrostomum lignano TaxID=282301 RepID=A0A1I8GRX4_9PLAT